jgi:hypothetical protein
LEKVRAEPQQIRKTSEEAIIMSTWYLKLEKGGTTFIPPPENPGLLSPGMNGSTITERALALA